MRGLTPAPSIYAIDDSEYARSWMCRWLSLRDEVRFVGHSSTLAGARQPIQDLRPDVLLLDARLPGENVAGFIRDLRLIGRRPAILMHSGCIEKRTVQETLLAGAEGYVGKDVDPDELVAAILQVHSGEVIFSDSVRRALRC